MADVELRELQLFLVLAEELHFGRTAERLGLTASRVSQTVRALERKLGGHRLFDRSSRVVTLTDAGTALRRDLTPALASLDAVVLRARERAAGPGLVRVGLLNAASGGTVLNRAIKCFESLYPGGTVRLAASPFTDRLGPLRRGDVDLAVTRLPLRQPDIEVGPLLSAEDSRVVMVAVDHPLAQRSEVTLEDLADYEVRRSPDDPSEVAEASCPSTTPSGRPIVAADIPVGDVSELLLLVAQGRLVHPTTAPFAEHFRHVDIAVVPLVDLPPSSSALCWLRGVPNPGRDAFLDVVRAESQLVAVGGVRKSLP
jgi:DNA-binding transcriptional LysR family regulator